MKKRKNESERDESWYAIRIIRYSYVAIIISSISIIVVLYKLIMRI